MELVKASAIWNLCFAANDCGQAYAEFGAEYNAYKNRYHPLVWFIINAIAHIKC